jgi:CRISPR-associated protein Cas2
MAMTVVITYDISEDRRRARVAATLQQYGDRVQRSVFVCALDTGQLSELLRLVTEMIDTATDSVYAFRQCAACWETVGVVGQATVDDEPYYWAVL